MVQGNVSSRVYLLCFRRDPTEAFFGEGGGGGRCKMFGREVPENGAKCAVLENLAIFRENYKENAINKENRKFSGFKFVSKNNSFKYQNLTKKNIQNNFRNFFLSKNKMV